MEQTEGPDGVAPNNTCSVIKIHTCDVKHLDMDFRKTAHGVEQGKKDRQVPHTRRRIQEAVLLEGVANPAIETVPFYSPEIIGSRDVA